MIPHRVPLTRTPTLRRARVVTEAALAPSPERVAPPGDRDRVDRVLRGFLAESRAKHVANPHIQPLFDLVVEFVLSGGKRLRPRLALASYRILAGVAEPPRAVRRAAASLELFHAFMLVHDDLIDGTLARRDRPTLHESIRRQAQAGDGRKRAADLGLIGGDLLCALGMRLLGRAGLDDAVFARAHRLIADILLETGLGEALDVLYEDCPLASLAESQILDAYLRKTARYTVSGPLALGAILAGADASTWKTLRRFGDLLGLGYQIENDLDGLAIADPTDACPDLDTGKRTWLLWKAHDRLDEPGRAAIVEALDMPVGARRRSRLLYLIRASGAIDEARTQLSTFRRDAVAALRESGLKADQRASYLALVSLFHGSSVGAEARG